MTFILTYHDVVPADRRDSVGFPGPVAARYKLTPRTFDRHLSRIAATRASVGLVEAGGALPGAALTFDDGGASALEVAAALEAHGWRGHFFVTTSRIGSPGFLTEPQVAELAARGHEVGSHSHTHPTYMGRLDLASLDAEWTQSRDLLAGILDAPPLVASVPGGFVTPAVFDSAARAGYRVLMTSEPQSRARREGELVVLGRYAIWATTPAATAAGYATGALAPRARLWLEWRVKTLAKRVSPSIYERGRRIRAG